VKSAYVKEFVARFPDAKRKYLKGDIPFSKLRKDSEMRLKEEIRFKQDAISEFQLMNTQSPTLKLLKDVSLAIPKDLKLDVSLFEYRATGAGLGNFTLKAETDNFSSGASIIEALAKVSNLKDVEEKQSGRKPGSDGKIIEFTVNAKYEAIP
jgi:type IV pilus assembly protein PilM